MSKEQGHCRTCGAPVRWVKTASGRAMPLDAEPVERGNVVLRDGRAVYVSKGNPAEQNEPRYVSHFATCPQSRDWRRR